MNVNYDLLCRKIIFFVNANRDKVSNKAFTAAMVPTLGRSVSSRLFNALLEKEVFVPIPRTSFKRTNKSLDWFTSDHIRDLFLEKNILRLGKPKGRTKGVSQTAQIIERLDKLDRFLSDKQSGDLISTIVELGMKLSDSGINVTIESGKVTFYK